MKPIVDDLELPLLQEISRRHRRVLAKHKPSGMDGSLLRNLGRRPPRLVLSGVAAQDGTDDSSAIDEIQKPDEKFRAGEPSRFADTLTLRKFIEPVESAALAAVDASILEDAARLTDDLLGGLDIATQGASGPERFATSMGDLLGRLQEFNDSTEKAGGG